MKESNSLRPGLATAGLDYGEAPCGLRAIIPEALSGRRAFVRIRTETVHICIHFYTYLLSWLGVDIKLGKSPSQERQ